MKEFDYYYELSPLWYKELAEKMEATLIDDKIMVIPEDIGKGYSFFTEVIPGLSVLFLDVVTAAPVKMRHLGRENGLYVINFDLSEEVLSFQIQNKSFSIESIVNLGLFVWRNSIENAYEHAAGKRVLILRLVVDQKLLKPLFDKELNLVEPSKGKNKFIQDDLCFYDHIDSNSKILINSLKNKSILNQNFDFYLRGIALKLLVNFTTRYSDKISVPPGINKADTEALEVSRNYLLKNLKNDFPGIAFLAKNAGISPTKYKRLFKLTQGITPHDFFNREKFLLAHKLLRNGSYESVVELAYDLNFVRVDYFVKRYFDFFGRKPSEDLLVKEKVA